ncbi:MAG: integration host factor subunit beta [Gammaproteobacteria bacterium]
MIKSELISVISTKLPRIPEKTITEGVSEILDHLSSVLVNGERIEIRDFGSFSLHYRPPRNAHNPKTGDRVVTKAKYSPHFKPGKELRERVNGSREHTSIHEDQSEE